MLTSRFTRSREFNERERALEKAGFKVVRHGKHIVMSDGTRILTIPRQTRSMV
jgi:very-short-patch-repair endonuclease